MAADVGKPSPLGLRRGSMKYGLDVKKLSQVDRSNCTVISEQCLLHVSIGAAEVLNDAARKGDSRGERPQNNLQPTELPTERRCNRAFAVRIKLHGTVNSESFMLIEKMTTAVQNIPLFRFRNKVHFPLTFRIVQRKIAACIRHSGRLLAPK